MNVFSSFVLYIKCWLHHPPFQQIRKLGITPGPSSLLLSICPPHPTGFICWTFIKFILSFPTISIALAISYLFFTFQRYLSAPSYSEFKSKMFELLNFIHSSAVSCLYFLPSLFAWLIPVHLLIFSPHISKFLPYYFFPILFHQIAPSCVPQKSAYIFVNALSTFYLSLDCEFFENKDSSVLFIFMSCSSPVT